MSPFSVQSNPTTGSTLSFMTIPTFPSSSEFCWDHDVFLNFRGEETRKNFADHLYSALVEVGIRTFRDDEEFRRGNIVSTELLNAIHGSRISIVVFSEGYAFSRRCLDELVEIVHCKNTIDHTLLPIFYNVDPSNVRHQTGTFAKALARHEEQQIDMEKVQMWKAALSEAANCSGLDLISAANGYESRFIKKIVKEVLNKVKPARLNVAMHPIGIDSRVDEMKVLLDLGTSDVRIVGIYGMCGIGKTTIAKATYNQICYEFDGSSCLLNVKEASRQSNGLVSLQKQLLFDIVKAKNLDFYNVDSGIEWIKERIEGKKVLIVLDDVDQVKPLHALVGNFIRFGEGSRIIVTTRDEQLLAQLGVHKKYKVEELNNWESLQLFSYHAFKMGHLTDDYKDLSIRAVEYARGLPIALEVLGSFLLGRSVFEWKSELEKLQRIPHKEIQKILLD